MNWTDDNIAFVKKAIDLKKKGYYIDSRQVVDKYNEILDKHRNYTSCGSCIRQIIGELEVALNAYEKQAAQSGLTTTELTAEIKAIEEDVLPKVKKKIKKHNKGE